LNDPTYQWKLWRDIELGVIEFVNSYGLRDAIYSDGKHELRVDVTGRPPAREEVYRFERPWFDITSHHQALKLLGDKLVRGLGFSNYIPYSWSLRKVN
jgi:hypothetical protein